MIIAKMPAPGRYNERVSPMDKVKIKPLNRPYRQGDTVRQTDCDTIGEFNLIISC
jgi:hypothetical protein